MNNNVQQWHFHFIQHIFINYDSKLYLYSDLNYALIFRVDLALKFCESSVFSKNNMYKAKENLELTLKLSLCTIGDLRNFRAKITLPTMILESVILPVYTNKQIFFQTYNSQEGDTWKNDPLNPETCCIVPKITLAEINIQWILLREAFQKKTAKFMTLCKWVGR